MVHDCPICLSPISGVWGVLSPCGHPFHRRCWEEWRAHNAGNPLRCVVCKRASEKFVVVYMSPTDPTSGVPEERQPREEPEGRFEFKPLTGAIDVAAVTSIDIKPFRGAQRNEHVNAMLTIMPSDTGEVSSYPAGLVTARVSRGNLSVSWNAAAFHASSGGVRIALPANKLESLRLHCEINAQILDGFTALRNIRISGASSFKAVFTSSAVSSIQLDTCGAPTVHVASNVNLNGNISGRSTVFAKTPAFQGFGLSGCSVLNVDGDVGTGTVSGCSRLATSGNVAGFVGVSGMSTLRAASCDDENAISCRGMSRYHIGPQRVDVDVAEEGHIGSGTRGAAFGAGNLPRSEWTYHV